MKAMILAAGFGTRLWPLTIGRTKPAIPFLNRPLIAYMIEYLRGFGITDLIINLHHEPDSVRQQIGDGSQYGVSIRYSIEEPEILGTSGALDRVRDQLAQETFIVVNGKIITDIDLNMALQTHRRQKALGTLVLRSNSASEYFREVKLTGDGRLAEFAGFPNPGDLQTAARNPYPPLMFTGIHILEPAIFDYIPRGVFSDSVKDVYPKAMADGKIIAGHVAKGWWYELSTLNRYLAISLAFLEREGKSVMMDEGARIEDSAIVERSIIWKRVKIEAGAKLVECIVGDDVIIPAGESFYRAAVVRAPQKPATGDAKRPDRVEPEKTLTGQIVGDNLVVHFGE